MEVTKVEEKITETDKGEETTFTYTLEGVVTKVVIKGPNERPQLTRGSEFNLTLTRPQSNLDTFHEEEEPTAETEEEQPAEASDRTGILILSKKSVPEELCGGLEEDIVIEKDPKTKLLYAVGRFANEPGSSSIEETALKFLEDKTGYSWTFDTNGIIRCDIDQLNMQGEYAPPKSPKEKAKAEPIRHNASIIKVTTVKGQTKHRWQCSNCEERWNRAPEKDNTITTCKGCKTDLLLLIATKGST